MGAQQEVTAPGFRYMPDTRPALAWCPYMLGMPALTF